MAVSRVIGIHIPQHAHGATIAMDAVIEFLRWADGTLPTAPKIMTRFGVSRATAYRYRLAYQTQMEKYGSLKFARK